MAKVVLKNVYKYYGDTEPAVANLSVEVEDEEFVVFVGPSGCGKTTTLRMVAGLEQISDGEVYIGDRLVNDVPPKGRDIAMVFQNYALYPHMNVFDNMAFGLKLRKIPKAEIRQRIGNAADILGITELLGRKPKALSGGQRQRVAVGRAIVRNPKVFLFDEPLSNLDAKLRVQMRAEISKLHKRLQATMVYVTHDQVEAMTMGDRIVVMKNGVAQQIDTPMNLYHHPQNSFVAGFIGSPAMNLVSGKITRDDGLWFDEGSFRVQIAPIHVDPLSKFENKDVIFGIRPEDIHEPGTPRGDGQPDEVKLAVEVVEPMGNETFLYLTTPMNRFTARLRTENKIETGARISVVFDLEKAHFFDKDSGEALYPD